MPVASASTVRWRSHRGEATGESPAHLALGTLEYPTRTLPRPSAAQTASGALCSAKRMAHDRASSISPPCVQAAQIETGAAALEARSAALSDAAARLCAALDTTARAEEALGTALETFCDGSEDSNALGAPLLRPVATFFSNVKALHSDLSATLKRVLVDTLQATVAERLCAIKAGRHALAQASSAADARRGRFSHVTKPVGSVSPQVCA